MLLARIYFVSRRTVTITGIGYQYYVFFMRGIDTETNITLARVKHF